MSDIDLSKPVAGKAGKAPVKKPPVKKAVVKGKPFSIDHRLGVEVRDPVTNLQGYATCRVEMLSGCVQFSIQPKDDKVTDKLSEAHFIDYNLLEEVGDGFAGKLPAVDPTVKVKLGDHVYDSVSKFRGIAIEKYTFQNGCVYFALQSTRRRQNVFGELPGATRIPHARLKQYRPWYVVLREWFRRTPDNIYLRGRVPQAAAAPVVTAPPPRVDPPRPRPPGGPSRSASSMSFRG